MTMRLNRIADTLQLAAHQPSDGCGNFRKLFVHIYSVVIHGIRDALSKMTVLS